MNHKASPDGVNSFNLQIALALLVSTLFHSAVGLTMELTLKDVQKVAKLARLKLSEDEQHRYVEKLGQVLKYVEMLNDVDTEGIEPMAHAGDLLNVFREDEVNPSLPRDLALSNAPKKDGKYFLVPQIIEAS